MINKSPPTKKIIALLPPFGVLVTRMFSPLQPAIVIHESGMFMNHEPGSTMDFPRKMMNMLKNGSKIEAYWKRQIGARTVHIGAREREFGARMRA